MHFIMKVTFKQRLENGERRRVWVPGEGVGRVPGKEKNG